MAYAHILFSRMFIYNYSHVMSQIEMYPVFYKFQLEFHMLWSRAFGTDVHMF